MTGRTCVARGPSRRNCEFEVRNLELELGHVKSRSIPDTWNHQQNQSSCGDHPANVTGIVIEVEILGEGVSTSRIGS